MTAAGAWLVLRRQPSEPEGPCCGEPVCGSQERQPVAVPGGWRRMTNAEAAPYVSAAVSILSEHHSAPYGTLVPVDASAAVMIEQHCHEPGGAVKPWGYHAGATLLARV